MANRKIDYEIIFKEYNQNNLSYREIAKKYNISTTSVYNAIHAFLPKSFFDKPSKLLTKEFLEEHYVKQKKNMNLIAKELGLKTSVSVKWALKKHGIVIEKRKRTIERSRDIIGNKKWKGYEDISGSFFSQIKSKARRRKIKFDDNLTIEYLWELFLKQNKKCKLSGENIYFRFKETSKRAGQTASLDRIDSRKHYSRDNVQWIHKDLQSMKMNKDQKSFLEWCNKISEYNKLK